MSANFTTPAGDHDSMPKAPLYAGTMTLEDAAAALGVALDATESDIQRAFKLRARDSHPDRFSGASPERAARAAEDFIRITAARDRLLQARRSSTPATPGAREYTASPRYRRISWQGLAAWLGIVVVAAFVSIVGAELPFTVAEPLVRFAALTVGLLGFALTGKQGYFVLIVLAILVTAVLAIAFTTLGALLGMFILSAPVIGLVLAGRARRASELRHRNQAHTRQAQ
ncbi:MAG: J domain-containing protein [Salinibacterium sp.]|nr:J domain-containing protein [Salinibacterium sp.]